MAEARLILLHGEPGTGKTTAIRALLRAWAPWWEAHIIGDPDCLFDNVAYLLEVVCRPPAHTVPRRFDEVTFCRANAWS